MPCDDALAYRSVYHSAHPQSGADLLSGAQSHLSLIHGRHGAFLLPRHDAYVGKSLLAYGEYVAEEFQILQQILTPKMTVLEVGANIGAHTVGLAKMVVQQGEYWAFEPQPFLHKLLQSNLVMNGLENVQCWDYGLGETRSSLAVTLPDYHQVGNFGAVSLLNAVYNDSSGSLNSQGTIEIHRLDDVFNSPRLDLIKIDVEGMERDVLLGAVKTIDQHRPVLYLENDRRDQSEALIKLLWDWNYRLWWHVPPLHIVDNYYDHPHNHFAQTVSVNMLAFPEEVNFEIQGFTPIIDSGNYPI